MWTLPTRFFHWYLVFGCVLAYSLAHFTRVHIAVGLSVLTIVLFRIIWGFVGPRYSHFRDFRLSLNKIILFVGKVKEQERLYVGHNPAASVVMIGIIVFAALVCSLGICTALTMNTHLFGDAVLPYHKLFMSIHEFLVYILMILAALHILGLASNWLFSRQSKAIKSMIIGYKAMPGVNAYLTRGHIIFASAAFSITVAVLILAWAL